MAAEWPFPFSSFLHTTEKPLMEAELRRELKPGNPLFGLPVAAVARRYDQDDVLFELLDGSGRVAQVHLTWVGESERPPWPGTKLFESLTKWAASVREEYADEQPDDDC
jgi:hypothetical protein